MARQNSTVVHIGIKGTVLALNRATGAIVWETNLKGSDFVNLVLDGGDLLASTRGEVFCLNPANGRLRWNNPLRGYGWGLASFATSDAASRAAVVAEYQRQQESNGAATAATSSTAAAT